MGFDMKTNVECLMRVFVFKLLLFTLPSNTFAKILHLLKFSGFKYPHDHL